MDCAGICGGAAQLVTFYYDLDEDGWGDCDDSFPIPLCDGLDFPPQGVLSGDCDACPTDYDLDNDCAEDCAGVVAGELIEDECGNCGGGCFESDCEYCEEDESNADTCDLCSDCAGYPYGDAIKNNCNDCVIDGDDTDLLCIQGCDAIWINDGTPTIVDECNVCGGDNSMISIINPNCITSLNT
jgi:hypothetical protein